MAMLPISRHSAAAGAVAPGFTLAEVLIGATLGSVVLLGIFTTFIFLAKTGYRIQNYTDMETRSHRLLELFAEDARMCQSTGIALTGSTAVTFTVPGYYAASGNRITYYYDDLNQQVCRRPGDITSTLTPEILMRQVTFCQFTGYDLTGPPARSTSDAAPIATSAIRRIEVTLRSEMTTGGNATSKVASTAVASENVVSATFLLRN